MGRRRPFFWGAARFTPSGIDLAKAWDMISQLFVKDRTEQPCWILCDFGPARTQLADVKTVLQRKMSMGRFNRFSSQLWQQSPLSLKPRDTLDISSYSARRCVMTDAARLRKEERAALWAEQKARGKTWKALAHAQHAGTLPLYHIHRIVRYSRSDLSRV